MHVLQFAKRTALALAAAGAVLTGCSSDVGPTPFNPTGASADLQAVNGAFASPTFASFSSQSVLFDAALGGAPLVSASAAALDTRGSGGLRAAAVRSGAQLARIFPKAPNPNFSALSAAIPAAFAGKTFVYSGGVYVVSDLAGAPSNGVRFLLYAVDPVTFLPAEPLNQTGYVDLTDLSTGSVSSARVVVVSGQTTYLNYTVTATSTLTSGRVTVAGFVTDGTTQANFNLRSTLTFAAGLVLVYGLDVPQRDLSIDLTMTASDVTTGTGTIDVNLVLRGGNGWVAMTGQVTADAGTLTVKINGTTFATITSTVDTVTIVGASGQPLTPEEGEALQRVFDFTSGSFGAFDELLAPAGRFVGG